MSLINQMLQDLDARKAAQGASSGLPNDVRPLPRVETSTLPLVLGAIVVLLVVAALLAYFLALRSEAALRDASPTPVVVAPALPAAPLQEPVIPPPAPVAEVLPPEPAVAETELQTLEGSLRLADILQIPTEKKSESKLDRPSQLPSKAKVAEETPVEKESKPAEAAPPSSTNDNKASPVTDKSPPPPMIEKTVALGSPRERAEAEYRKAIGAVNQGRVDEALAGLRSALQHDTFHQASRQLLVKLLLEAMRPDEAVQILQDGLQAQPAQIAWAMSLARLQMDRNDLAGAWQTLNYSQPAATGNADYQGFSGHVLQRLGRHKEAIERYVAAVRLSPSDGRWWLGLGLSLEAEARSSEAREAFQRAASSGNLSAELAALVDQKLR